MADVEVPHWLRGLPLAPEYHPTEAEFTDPVEYISKIESEARQYGICKIVPPWVKASKKTVLMNLNNSLAGSQSMDMMSVDAFSCKGRNMGGVSPIAKVDKVKPATLELKLDETDVQAKFSTRRQQVGSNSRRLRGGQQFPAQKLVWQSGESYTLEQFEAKAKAFARDRLGTCKDIAPLTLEALFWKATVEKPLSVEYANDIPGSAFAEPYKTGFTPVMQGKKRKRLQQKLEPQAPIHLATKMSSSNAKDAVGDADTLNFKAEAVKTSEPGGKLEGSTSGSKLNLHLVAQHCDDGNDSGACEKEGLGWKLANSAWNMRRVARSPGSLLRFMPDEVPGVTSPMVYIGMLFSWFAWHVEDHELHSLNYLHMGSPKTWYAAPPDVAFALEEVIRIHGYGNHIDSKVALSLLGEKTTILSPEVLVSTGVPCCRLVQNAGEFVVTFPRSYHLGFSHGFNCGEAANFATPGWLEVAKEAAVRRVALNHLPMLSHQQLLYYHAMSFPSRTTPCIGSKIRSSRLELKKKSLGEEIVKTKFVNDVIYSDNLLKNLLDCGVSCCLIFADIMKTQEDNCGWGSESVGDFHSHREMFKKSNLQSVEGWDMPVLLNENNTLGRRLANNGHSQNANAQSSLVSDSGGDDERASLFDSSNLRDKAKFNFNGGFSSCGVSSEYTKDNQDVAFQGSCIDWESLTCAACGSLCFLSMAVIQPSVTAACTLRETPHRDWNKLPGSCTNVGTSMENEVVRMESLIGSGGWSGGTGGCVSEMGNTCEGIICNGTGKTSMVSNGRQSSTDATTANEKLLMGNSDFKKSEGMNVASVSFGSNISKKLLLEKNDMNQYEFGERNSGDMGGTCLHDKGLITPKFDGTTLADQQLECAPSYHTNLTSLELLAATYEDESASDDDDSSLANGNLLSNVSESTLGDKVSAVGLSTDGYCVNVKSLLGEITDTTVLEAGKLSHELPLNVNQHGNVLAKKNFTNCLLPSEADECISKVSVRKDSMPSMSNSKTRICSSSIKTGMSESLTENCTPSDENLAMKDIPLNQCQRRELACHDNIHDLDSDVTRGCSNEQHLSTGEAGFMPIKWQGHDTTRPRIMCLEHAFNAQLQLKSRGGGHVIVVFHPSFEEFRQRAQYLALELGINHEWIKAPLSSPNKDILQIVNAAIDSTQDRVFAELDWVVQLGMNVRQTQKMMEKRSSENFESLEDRVFNDSACHDKALSSSERLRSETAEKSWQLSHRSRPHLENKSSKGLLRNRHPGKHLKEKKCWVVGRWCGRDWRLDQVHVLLGGCRETLDTPKYLPPANSLCSSLLGAYETATNPTTASESLRSQCSNSTETGVDSSSSEELRQSCLRTSCIKRKDRGQKIISLYARKQRHISTIRSSRCRRKVAISGSYRLKELGYLSRRTGRKRKLVASDLYAEQKTSLKLSRRSLCHKQNRVATSEGLEDAYDLFQGVSSARYKLFPPLASERKTLHSDASIDAENSAAGALLSPTFLPAIQISDHISIHEKNIKPSACRKSWKLDHLKQCASNNQALESAFSSVEPQEASVPTGSPSRKGLGQSNCSLASTTSLIPSTSCLGISPSFLQRGESLGGSGPLIPEVVNDTAASYRQSCSTISSVSLSETKDMKDSGIYEYAGLITSKTSEELMRTVDTSNRSVWCDVPIVCAPSIDSIHRGQQGMCCDEKNSCSHWISQKALRERFSPFPTACVQMCGDSCQLSCNVADSSMIFDERDNGFHHLLEPTAGKFVFFGPHSEHKDIPGQLPHKAQLKDLNAESEQLDASQSEHGHSQIFSHKLHQMNSCNVGPLETNKFCSKSCGLVSCENDRCLCCDIKKGHDDDHYSEVTTMHIKEKELEAPLIEHKELDVANEAPNCIPGKNRQVLPVATSRCWPCHATVPMLNVMHKASGSTAVHEEDNRDCCHSNPQCSNSMDLVIKPCSKLRSKRAKHSGWKKCLQSMSDEDAVSQESREELEASNLQHFGRAFKNNPLTSSGEYNIDFPKLKPSEGLYSYKGDSGPFTRLRSRCSAISASVQNEAVMGDAFRDVQGNTLKKHVRKGKKHSSTMDLEERSKPYQCEIDGCGMKFATNKELLLHMSNMCTFKGCGKRLCTHNYLLQHFRVHVDDRPLKCPWKGCKKTFKWAWARTEHIRVHTGERPYVCKVCDKRYRFVSDFSRHKRTTGHTPNV